MLQKNILLKQTNIFKTIFIIIIIIMVIFIFLEILARQKFNTFTRGSCSKEKLSIDSLLYVPQKNCVTSVKHWENNNEIIYKTDENGNRKSTMPVNFNKNVISIAFFGDSFTWGDMNTIEENYTHHAVAELRNVNVGYSNFGVPGYNLLQILERMKLTDLKNYNYIVYGLTPNDLFFPQIIPADKQQKQETSKVREKTLLYIFKEKIRHHDIRSVKVAGKLLFEIFPKFYINLYTLRDSKLAGYLSINSSPYWNDRYSELLVHLKNLDLDIRNRLIIQIIPQRVQVQLYAKGDLNSALAFDNRIILMCDELKIKCNNSQLEELSNLENSHFTIDGHFTASANKIVGKGLAKFISDLLSNK